MCFCKYKESFDFYLKSVAATVIYAFLFVGIVRSESGTTILFSILFVFRIGFVFWTGIPFWNGIPFDTGTQLWDEDTVLEVVWRVMYVNIKDHETVLAHVRRLVLEKKIVYHLLH